MEQNRFFPEIRGNFGFGCMRLPMKDGKVDAEEFRRMADAFINAGFYYNNVVVGGGHGRASDCIRCGKCERVCPQHLPIRKPLGDVAAAFDKK